VPSMKLVARDGIEPNYMALSVNINFTAKLLRAGIYVCVLAARAA
jgi:hypothetical protein